MKESEPSTYQMRAMERVFAVLRERRGKDNAQTRALLEEMGFTPVWRRVAWAGGCGTWRYMPRLKVCRVQICANVQANRRDGVQHIYMLGMRYSMKGKKVPNGYRYAWCVEV